MTSEAKTQSMRAFDAELGVEYELIRSRRKTLTVQIRQGKMIVRAPLRTADSQISAFFHEHRKWITTHLSEARQAAARNVHRLTEDELRALTERAREVISERVAYYAPHVGVTYGTITIRHQHTRWGSCSENGNLSFNCLLLLAPPEVLDSIVVHELCHRKQMNHSKRFYAEVFRVFPNYQSSRSWLKKNGPVLLAMIDGSKKKPNKK